MYKESKTQYVILKSKGMPNSNSKFRKIHWLINFGFMLKIKWQNWVLIKKRNHQRPLMKLDQKAGKQKEHILVLLLAFLHGQY